jgi:hypothetical protein
MSLTKATYAMIDGAVANVLDYGADSTGVADSTTAIQAALNSGSKSVYIPFGTYKITSELLITGEGITVYGDGCGAGASINVTTIKLYTSVASTIALRSTATQTILRDICFESNSGSADGLALIGFKHAKATSGSVGRCISRNLRFLNFSYAAIQLKQTIDYGLENVQTVGGRYGVDIGKSQDGTVVSTTVTLANFYVTTAAEAGFFCTSITTLGIRNCIFEYCGTGASYTATGAAIYAVSAGSTMYNCYFEANYRNYNLNSAFVKISPTEGSTTVPNLIVYNPGIASASRGYTDIRSNTVKTRFLLGNDYDLQFGENLIAPLAGGSVEFGNMTTENLTGTITSGIWNTIKTFTDQTGAMNARASYQYTIWTGQADKPNGFDSGTIMNEAIYSASGSLPAWIQMSGSDLQLNFTDTSYGLNWKLVLVRIYPGNP